MMEISILPVGTKKTSISQYVAACEKVLQRRKGIKAQLTAMGTIVEASSVKALFAIAQEMHEAAFVCGLKRVYTVIKIDDRRDKKSTIESKVEAVRKRLG